MAARRKKLTDNQRAFLKSFGVTGSITKAAEAAQVDRSQHYRWLDDAVYSEAFDGAREEAAQTLEDEAVKRAHEGVLEPVFYKGKPAGAVRKYSDSLLVFLLKGFRPEKYRDRGSVEVTGAGGAPLEIVARLNAGRDRLAKRESGS